MFYWNFASVKLKTRMVLYLRQSPIFVQLVFLTFDLCHLNLIWATYRCLSLARMGHLQVSPTGPDRPPTGVSHWPRWATYSYLPLAQVGHHQLSPTDPDGPPTGVSHWPRWTTYSSLPLAQMGYLQVSPIGPDGPPTVVSFGSGGPPTSET